MAPKQDVARALEDGDVQRLADLLHAGLSADHFLDYGSTLLIDAASRRRADQVELLLEARADPNLRGRDANRWRTPIEASLSVDDWIYPRGGPKPDPRIVRLLLAAFAEPFPRAGSHGELVRYGKEPLRLLRREMNALGIAHEHVARHVTVLARAGDAETLRFLLDGGAPVNGEAPDYPGPLHASTRGGHVEIVELLLSFGADPEGAFAEPPMAVIGFGKGNASAIAERLLQAGASVDPETARPLLSASRHGRVDLVKLMIRAGADPHRCDDEGRLPIDDAFRGGNAELAAALLQTEAHPEIEAARCLRAIFDDDVAAARAALAAGVPPQRFAALLREARGLARDAIVAILAEQL